MTRTFHSLFLICIQIRRMPITESCFAECRFAEFRLTECQYAELGTENDHHSLCFI